MSNDNLTQELARFAATFEYDRMPDSARAFARNFLLDSIACALAGIHGDETAAVQAFARNVGQAGETTVIGSEERLSLLGATLINGYLITAVTVCDAYLPAHVHISPEVIPPALAIAERDAASGRDLLAAIALGSEVAVRVAAGLDYSVAGKLGWHFPGIVGPFAAAAAVGRLRGLSELQMRNALGLAGSQSAGTWASWGSPAVKFHQARGAVSGLLAALLAEQNFQASADIIGHRDGGMLVAYSTGGKPELILQDLGSRFEFEQISLRLWPGGAPLQPALTAAYDLATQEKPDLRAVERVRVCISEDVYGQHGRFAEPRGVFEALLSFPFTVTSMLRDRGLWLDSVAAARIGDPDLRGFMRERVDLVADPSLNREQATVELLMRDGRRIAARADAAKGTPRNPASLDDLRAKFERCAADRLSPEGAAELLDLLVRIEQLDDLKRLFALLGSAGQAEAARRGGRTNAA